MNAFTRQHSSRQNAFWRRLGGLAVITVATVTSACNSPSLTEDSGDSAIADPLSNDATEVTAIVNTSGDSAIADRSAYDPIERSLDGSWPDTEIFDVEDLSPFSLAREYLATQAEGGECLRWTQTRIERLDNDITAVAVTTLGLCDDSLGGVEKRYDLALTSSGWTIDWAGTRYYCSRTTPPDWIEPGSLCP